MHKTTVYLPDELKAALARAARERGCAEAALIRQAIEALTRGPEAPPPRLPLFRASGPPIAEEVDAFLDGGFGRE
jgi:hypothetical protein